MKLIDNLIDLPSLQCIVIGNDAFAVSVSTVIESMVQEWMNYRADLPSLHSIELGNYALFGSDEEYSCLQMKSIGINCKF